MTKGHRISARMTFPNATEPIEPARCTETTLQNLPWSLLSMVMFMNVSINAFQMQGHVCCCIKEIVNDEVERHWKQDGFLRMAGQAE